MTHYFKIDEWKIIEEGFNPEKNKVAESVFSLGNGRMGQRGNFEEMYTGESLPGNYIAGVYYPDKTRVGWWKNGYPEYFAKVLNAANWIGIDVWIGNEQLDLANCKIISFRRELDMKEGLLRRSFHIQTRQGSEIKVEAIRFCSMADDETGVIRYAITPVAFNGTLTITPFVDGDIKNADANYDEKFWDDVKKQTWTNGGFIQMRTKKTGFEIASGQLLEIKQNGKLAEVTFKPIGKDKYIANVFQIEAVQGETITLYKYAANVSSQNYAAQNLEQRLKDVLKHVSNKGFETMMLEQASAWEQKWKQNDIIIDGDPAAQQGIRFNIFQLNQTYTGEDDRLNIGPKGFTGEKYGGSTYWDTEAYCVPFYLATADAKVTRNLLLYRYKQLNKAIENATLLGFTNGAALYPMVTMDGTECHNEWEITFEEIHRNGAIAYAIYNYVKYTGDDAYLADYGLEVLIAIARFWSQRVNWSEVRQAYVMLGVTGPNEYENNVNNNWYTNTLAVWCIKYTIEIINKVKASSGNSYQNLVKKINFSDVNETEHWKDIVDKMYFPYDKNQQIFLQQDGYMDKQQMLVKDLPQSERPINQKWSWDRILRSCFIKQADVLQGLYFFEDDYNLETIQRNFDFYEPRTVHESSLSPCVHAILAAKLGDEERAYQFYLRTSRLDLDDYNNDTDDGCHITSMAGTWMAVVQGFGGMRIKNNHLSLAPLIPAKWNSISFNIGFRGVLLSVKADHKEVIVNNLSNNSISVFIYGKEYKISSLSENRINR